MPNPLYTFGDLQVMEAFDPEIIKGTFTFDENTIDLEFVDLSGRKELKQIVFKIPQPRLRYLNASNCSLTEVIIPKGCKSLEMLYLHHNQITEIIFEGDCPRLELIDVSNNKLTRFEIHPDFERLGNLFLANNQLVDLTGLSRFAVRENFDLNIQGNETLKSPPAEIAKQGNEALINYYLLLEEEKAKKIAPRYNFEVKLLIIGEGGTGKTTLLRKLQDVNALMPEVADTTKGINIEKWEFPLDRTWVDKIPGLFQHKMQANCWDFGGQKLYHGTHQIFFGENSFYILVEETREQKTDFSYWFNTIEQLVGDNARLMVVINQKHGHVLKFDKTGYQERFKFLHHVEELDLQNDSAKIILLQKLIKEKMQQMPGVGNSLSATYIKIRSKLFELKENFISLDKLIGIAKENNLSEPGQIRTICRYFNDTGAITFFMDDSILCNRIYLNSDWLVKTVYKVLDDEVIKEKKGRITNSDFEHIFKEENLDFEVGHFTRIMHKFGLMYNVQDTNDYVVPSHLPNEKPYKTWKHSDKGNPLLFKYKFDKYMPEGLMSHFIVSLHPFIEDQNLVWHRGVNICYENTYAEIIETYGGVNTFEIKIVGAHKKDLLAVIRYRFNKILKPFKKLEVDERVPCNCAKCNELKEPHFYEYKVLQEFMEENAEEITCLKGKKPVNVKGLLGEVFSIGPEKLGVEFSEFAGKMNEKLDKIYETTEATLCNTEIIKASVSDVLSKFGESEQRIINSIIENYNETELRIVNSIISSIKTEYIDTNDEDHREAEELLQEINQRLESIEFAQKEAYREKLKTELSTGARLKLTIPLIPLLLSYESHFGFDSRIPLSWKGVKDMFKKQS